MVLLCMATSGFAKKRLHLEARARCPIPPVEVFIDEISKELVLDLGERSKTIRVIITDLSGNNICNNDIEVNGTFVLPLPMISTGKYILSVIFEHIELEGCFNVEEK